jgi:hypothetical protein
MQAQLAHVTLHPVNENTPPLNSPAAAKSTAIQKN